MGKAILQANDGVNVTIEKDLALKMSPKIRDKLREITSGYEHEGERDINIPLPLVNSAILKLAVEWADYHKNIPVYDGQGQFFIRPRSVTDWDAWEQKFVKDHANSLEALKKAAWYLKMKPLWIAMRLATDPKDTYFWHTYVARYNVSAEWDEEIEYVYN